MSTPRETLRPAKPRKPDLRELARGQECQVRLPGCDYGTETTVLAHIRRGGVAGMGQKPPDLCGVYACSKCHDVIDGRARLANVTKADIDHAVFYGLLRTLAIVSRELES